MKYLLVASLLISLSCSGQQVKKCPELQTTKYSSHKEVGELLKNQSAGIAYENVYVIFAADWCPSCQKLFVLLEDENLIGKVTLVDIEKTWGFLFSKEMNINSVPAMAVISSNKTIQVHVGLKEVYINLRKRLKDGKEIKLIQGGG
mgnify:CR=1 FL=1|tara:strand:- start:2103 stop:2540 length:438 start_codon:yes stop_codon:yes gene_type:complete